jgi:phosphoribosylanthranilate isomerase
MTRIKICGVTRPADAAHAVAAGADLLGLNFWPRSKRYLAPADAVAVAAAARAAGAVQLAGVFVNAGLAEVAAIARDVGLDVIQLHGDETVADARALADATGLAIWKAFAVGRDEDVDQLAGWPPHAPAAFALAAVLLDAPSAGRGGSGHVFDWQLARAATQRHPAHRVVLAGGLHPDNVAAAVAAARPWAVDVASGVEAAPGIKDPGKVTAFIAAARLIARD